MTPAPIPSRLLPSTATVRVPAPGDYGGEFAEPVELRGVRFERAAQLANGSQTQDGRPVSLSDGEVGLLFIDAVNTTGAFRVPEGSLVSVDGAPERVASRVEELRGLGPGPHHWEVALK